MARYKGFVRDSYEYVKEEIDIASQVLDGMGIGARIVDPLGGGTRTKY
jgi:hypothetical protein